MQQQPINASREAAFVQVSLFGAVADSDLQQIKDRLGALTGIFVPKTVDDVVYMYQPLNPIGKAKKGMPKPLPGRVILTYSKTSTLWTIEHFGDRQKTVDMNAMMRKVIRLPSTKDDGRKFMKAQGQSITSILRKEGVRYEWVCDAAINGRASVTIVRVKNEELDVDAAQTTNVTDSDSKGAWMVELEADARPDTLRDIGEDVFRKSQHLEPLVVWQS